MRFVEFSTKPLKAIKPKAPDQARIDGLRQQKERAGKALKAEQERQKIARAQAQLLDAYRIGNGG